MTNWTGRGTDWARLEEEADKRSLGSGAWLGCLALWLTLCIGGMAGWTACHWIVVCP
jgi:hypothetical protein